MAVAQILGGEAISDFQGLRHLGPVTGPVASTSTVWRALSEVGDLQLTRLNTAVTEFRRHWWAVGLPPGKVPLAAGRRPGAERDHGGGPGRLGRVRLRVCAAQEACR